MSISHDEAFSVALSDACEDYTGLYELMWEFNERFAFASEADRFAVAQIAVTRLVREGLASVFRTRWMSDEYEALDVPAALSVVADVNSWRSPAEIPDSRFYCFASTSAGDAQYFGPSGSTPAAG